ncbi:MAG TPA: O-antigen ligase family protein [Candidatus Limnocylindria bacterium]
MSRRSLEIGALVIGLAVWAYLGWDGSLWDPRFQVLLHLCAAATLVGLVVLLVSGAELPRTQIDLPILALLVAFGIATLSAANAGLSARALAASTATAAMLPVALLALRHRPGWTAAIVILPTLALATGSLAVMVWRRLEWVLAGGPGLPPVRLQHEGTPFGSVAVPAFVLMAALPLALLVPDPQRRRWLVTALLAVGIPTALISGSRSAWLTILVAGGVLIAPGLGSRLRGIAAGRRPLGSAPRRGRLLPMLAAAAGIVAALVFVGPRLLEAGSLGYRLFLWRDTLNAWNADRLFGVGPGAMPFLRQAAAPDLTFPVRQPHSHNVALGILGDAGIIGLLLATGLFVAFVVVAGPWRTRSLPGRAAFAVLMGFAVGMLFEDLTFLPNFNLLVIGLVAIALADAGAVRWLRAGPMPRRRRRAAAMAAVAGLALAVPMLVGDAAAIAYRLGVDAAWEREWQPASRWLQRSVALDPWHPSGPKALAVAADHDGRAGLALAAAREAVRLNPGDGPTWTNIALLCAHAGDVACARHAAERAVAKAAIGQELVNAAAVFDSLGDTAAADAAYRRSALMNFWTTLTHPWPRMVDIGSGEIEELGEAAELNQVIARAAQGQPLDPEAYEDPHARLLAFAVRGEWEAATAEAERAKRTARNVATTWDLAALLVRQGGGDPQRELRIGEIVRGLSLVEGAADQPRLSFDIATFRAYPGDELVSSAVRLLPDVPWPWILERLLPAGGG